MNEKCWTESEDRRVNNKSTRPEPINLKLSDQVKNGLNPISRLCEQKI